MSVTKKEVEHIADLARLKFPLEEMDSLIRDLNEILDFVDELKSLPTDDVEPTLNPIHIEPRMRDDVPGKELGPEKALMNAPDRLEDYLKVPSVLEVEDAEY